MNLARRNLPVIRDAEKGSAAFIPHIDLEAVLRLVAASAEAHPRTKDRPSRALTPGGGGSSRFSLQFWQPSCKVPKLQSLENLVNL